MDNPHLNALLSRREQLLGPNTPLFYDEPVHIVRGEDVWLWDVEGRKYLDCYNNVPHVGHCNPKVVEAIAQQAATLNVHTRYLHESILDYVERLTATFEPDLSTAILTCTGSEANDIALRMGEAVTGNRGFIATDATYHGNTALVSQLSRNNAPGTGDGDWVRFVPSPDSYRPQAGTAGQPHAEAFAESVRGKIRELQATAHGFAGMILCPYFVNEGFPNLHKGWLKPAVDAVHEAGGIFIADEVQPGFGRVGSHFWGHQRQGISPDVVTLGKPMANGHPVGAVVTTPHIIAAFRKSFRYFNTFGGNPVSCAAAMAVLNELEERDLVRNAQVVGEHAQKRLLELRERFEFVADVRGSGMIFGAEMVLDRTTKTPATEFTQRVVNAMRHRGILLSSLGRHKNTLKIRPPMTFTIEHADHLFDVLNEVLLTAPLKI